MYVRISSIQASPDKIDQGLRYTREGIDPKMWENKGFQGAKFMVDRASGRVKAFTFWDSKENLDASDADANGVRRRVAEEFGATQPPTRESYEIFHEIPAPGQAEPAVQFLRTEPAAKATT